jgi:hypothetical protein
MSHLNLKEWKNELQEAEIDGDIYISITLTELEQFIKEIETLRKKLIEHEE